MIWCPICGNEKFLIKPLIRKDADPFLDLLRCCHCGKQFSILWSVYDREDYIYTHLAHFFDPLKW
jgi:uncharacterized Zn finger protein